MAELERYLRTYLLVVALAYLATRWARSLEDERAREAWAAGFDAGVQAEAER